MIPTIGLVVCGYVFVRMLEVMLSADARPAVKQCVSLMMLGTVVAAVLLIVQGTETRRALDEGTVGAEPAYKFATTTMTTVPYGIDTVDPPLFSLRQTAG